MEKPAFDWKIFLFRLWTFVYTTFLIGFTTSYAQTQNLDIALKAGLTALIVGAVGALGYDQIKFSNSKLEQENTIRQLNVLHQQSLKK